MNHEYEDFEYSPLLEIPDEFRQVDRTFLQYHERPFSEAEEAFRQLREVCAEAFVDKPFWRLHFLRAVENRLVTLAVQKKQPISKCLEYIRRRLDLEYSRSDIYGKAAQLVVFADYAAECGHIQLAVRLLREERLQLKETAEICQCWLETVTQRIDKLQERCQPPNPE